MSQNVIEISATADATNARTRDKLHWQRVFEALCRLGVPSTRREILAAVLVANPQFKESNLDADLRLITVNDLARGHHQGHEPPRRTDQHHRYDLLFKRYCQARKAVLFERYDPDLHGVWELYCDDSVLTKSKMRTRAYAGGVLHQALQNAQQLADGSGSFDFINEPDARDKTVRAIVQRRGQAAFRRALLKAYDGGCALTGCTAVDVLEAAHIVPYNGEHTNRVANGLLLRADIHTLFDLGALWVEQGAVQVAAHLLGTEYAVFAGNRLRIPSDPAEQPCPQALEFHAQMARAGLGLVSNGVRQQTRALNFPNSRMYSTVDGIAGEQLNACNVVLRDEVMVIEYVTQEGSRVTYQARQVAQGQFEIRQELEDDDYLYTGALHREASDFYEGTWYQRYGNEHKQGSWSIELA